MSRRPLIWRLYISYVVIVFLATAGVVWVSAYAELYEHTPSTQLQVTAITALLMTLLAAVFGFFIAHSVRRALTRIRLGAERFARGDFTHQLPLLDSDEIGGLAGALNRMAQLLDEKVRATLKQSHEQQAVLASMVEGVMAVDSEERVLSLNGAAAQLLRVNPDTAVNRQIQEVVRNAQLQQFVTRTLSSRKPVEGDVVLYLDGAERFLQVTGTVLYDDRHQRIGALVVLNDVTRLRRLENMRREFVANVSHELKTPITSIKGFIETLQEGAIDDPEKSRQFLSIASRQADRLHAIIEDLLKLSHIEQSTERSQVEMTHSRLRPILEAAVEDRQAAAAEASVTLELHPGPEIELQLNPQLLEQAVVNLLDNAIKYSGKGAKVEVMVETEEHDIAIHVRDSGVGISAEHLPHLFDRFYRVDKGRSRKLGGTGLGLAIVKHIAQAHRGSASVQSTLGRGSTFTIHLPRMEAVAPSNATVHAA